MVLGIFVFEFLGGAMNKEKIERFIRQYFQTNDNVRFNKWNYEDGCILLAAIKLYKATGDNIYKDFVINYLSQYVLEDGTIKHYSLEEYNLDNIAPGRALIFAYEETKEERYFKNLTCFSLNNGISSSTFFKNS